MALQDQDRFEMPTSQIEEASRGRARLKVSLLVVLGLLMAPLLTAGLFHRLIERQDAIVNDERVRQSDGLLALFSHTQDVAVADNANWDEAYREIVIDKNHTWFQKNIGAFQFGTMPHDAAAVVDAEGNTIAGSWLGSEGRWDLVERTSPVGFQLLMELKTDREAGSLGSFVRSPTNVGYITMSELLPESGDPIAERRFLVFYYHLDAERVAELREVLSWRDLTVSLNQPEQSFRVIEDAFDNAVGYFGWEYPSPGLQAMKEIASLMLLSLVLGIISVLGLFLQVLRTTRRLIGAQREALHVANTDPLTRVANRRLLRSELGAALSSGHPFQLFVIDLDGFKAVNDAHGHRSGDAVLVELSGRLSALMGMEDVLARMGGDEFAVIRYGTHDDGEEYGARLVRAIAVPIDVSGQIVTLSSSVGVANMVEGLMEEEMLRRADTAMYSAKAARAGTVRIYDPGLDGEVRRSAKLDRDMRLGLRRGEFCVHYQPIFSVAEGRITSVEALARWMHPVDGPIPPDVFIRVAEKTGFIKELGAFVLQQACAAIAPSDFALSVNLSPVQMLDPQLVPMIAGVLRESGLSAERLELEITESTLIAQEAHASDVIARLRALGIRIALDDFGSGYASIGYMQRFPLDKIKIDRSFVTSVAVSSQAREVAAGIVTLSRAFQVLITAEGIETRAQADLLSAMGCDLLQGWHIGRPVPAADLPAGSKAA
jgi:diguanylate cyclase (GGDEF)-like protein